MKRSTTFDDNASNSYLQANAPFVRRKSTRRQLYRKGFHFRRCHRPVLERYYQELLNFCCRTVRDRDVAADVVQESYARVLSVQHTGQPVIEPRALLHQTARRLMIDRHRRGLLRDHDDIDALAEAEQPMAPDHMRPDEMLATAQVVRAYVAAIEGLPPRCREAFVLHVFDEMPQMQIAQRMGISRSMVEKHVVRGMLACKLCERQLREQLDAS